MFYNPLDKNFKSVIGAVKESDTVTFRVKGVFDSVLLMCKKDGEDFYVSYAMTKNEDCFSCDIKFDKGLYFYNFKLSNGKYLGCGDRLNGVVTDQPIDYQLTSTVDDFNTPDWIKGGIIYQIFPDRFCSSLKEQQIPDHKILRRWGETPYYLPNEQGEVLNNDFFGGDILGIISKLDYLVDLGVNTLYLNPIFEAYSNHRYDTGDYNKIDRLLGSLEDFSLLIKECNKRSIKVVLDGVFNHVGADSVYFNKYNRYGELGAYQSKESPYYPWFNFTTFPDEYESWWGIKTLPQVNETNLKYQDFITGADGVIEKYTKLGVSGWRLDVVDELPSQFVKKIRDTLKRINPQGLLIGEVWEDASNKISYGVRREYFQGLELDSVMNYPLKDAIIDYCKNRDCNNLVNVILSQIDHYPNQVLNSLMNILSTHDTFRLLSALLDVNLQVLSKTQLDRLQFSDEQIENALFSQKIASLLQFTLFGVPSIYYGDEISMHGFIDPLNRKCFEWDKIDNNQTLSWYKSLAKLRSSFSVFKDGEFRLLKADRGLFVYSRNNASEGVMVAVNLSNANVEFEFTGTLKEYFSQKVYDEVIRLEANSFGVFYAEG